MERLLADASELSGIEYNIDNLGDVYEAIHVIQGELGLTGVAADEASSTISGSFGAMKAAAQNFFGYLVIGEDLQPALTELVSSASTFLFDNLVPAIGNIISALPGVIGTVVTEIAPEILDHGLEMMHSLADGLGQTGDIVTSAVNLITTLLQTIIQRLPEIIATGVEIIAKLVVGLIQAIPQIIAAIPQIIKSLVNAFTSFDWASVGKGIIDGIKQGITRFASNLVDSVRGVASSAIQGAKNLLGIKSPSRVFRDQVGKMIDLGLAEGITGNIGVVEDAMDTLGAASFSDMGVNMYAPSGALATANGYGINASNNDVIDALYQVGRLIVNSVQGVNLEPVISANAVGVASANYQRSYSRRFNR